MKVNLFKDVIEKIKQIMNELYDSVDLSKLYLDSGSTKLKFN